jgi:hypothetical protein
MNTEYGKIETLFERDPKTFSVIPGQFKSPVYSLLRTWRWTEKVDGTNVRIIFTPETQIIDGDPYPSSSKLASVKIGGRTDNAAMPADLVQNILDIVTAEKMAASFQSPVVLYGEGYGAGIQKNGGGYSSTKKFILFDVFVDNRWWLNQEQITDVASKLGLDVVPFIGDWSLEEATEFVKAGFMTRVPGATADKKAEGLVGRPIETMYDKNMHRIITKLKTKDFTGGKDVRGI